MVVVHVDCAAQNIKGTPPTETSLLGGGGIMLDIYTDMDWVMCSERKDITHRLKEMKIISLQTEFKDTWKLK